VQEHNTFPNTDKDPALRFARSTLALRHPGNKAIAALFIATP
jgi:hypothetical protein